MNHILVNHDANTIVNWQLYPQTTQTGLAPNAVLLLVGRDIAPDVHLIRGLPRTDYARVYHVLPQGRSDNVDVADFLAAKHAGYQTVGWSYDDAGIGNLSNRTSILHAIDAVRRDEFVTWYAENYTGVKVIFV